MKKESTGKKNSKSVRQRVKEKSEKIRRLVTKVAEDELSLNKFYDSIIKTIKVLTASTRKFMRDDCLTKASSISYTTVVSLIPTLAVILTIYSIFSGAGDKKEDIFRTISIFLLEHNIKLNVDPIFSTISGLIDNAGKIGGVSAAIMIFSATAMLRSLEKSLNDIWKVKKQRPIFLKIIYYWAALTLGPVMLIAGTTVASRLTDTFSSPGYKSAFPLKNGEVWITGSKATILHAPPGKKVYVNLKNRNVDFTNQKVYSYDNESGNFSALDSRVDPVEFKKTNFNDIEFKGNRSWVVGSQGIVLISDNRGESWRLFRFGNHNFKDIHMVDKNEGFLITLKGTLFKTQNSGSTWTQVFSEKELRFDSITFNNNTACITANNGTLFLSRDSGKTWKKLNLLSARRKERSVQLGKVFFLNNNEIWIPCSEGVILHSTDGGSTFKRIIFLENDYTAAMFFDKNSGIIAGKGGRIITTSDGGNTWEMKAISSSTINGLYTTDGKVMALGDRGLILKSSDKGKTWKGTEGRSIMAFLINFFAPFIFIWLLFLLAYTSMPNTRVPFKYAAIGASFTGAVWVIFILLFIYYIKGFAVGTFAIYGALASIPLFLLMVYASSVIILYGAEVSYTLMHPETYRRLKKIFSPAKEIQIFHGIAMLHRIYRNFEKGKGATTFNELTKATGQHPDDIENFLKIFTDNNLISLEPDKGYMPARGSDLVKLSDLIDMSTGMDVPSHYSNAYLKNRISRIFSDMRTAGKKAAGDITLGDIIKEG